MARSCWVALPEPGRDVAPRFEHHTDLPVVTDRGLSATVLLGEFAGARSPGRAHSPLAGVDVTLGRGADVLVPLEPGWEYAVLPVAGHPDVDGGPLAGDELLYLGSGRHDLRLRASAPGDRFLLIGGEPFDEQIVMFWNFVGRSAREIAGFREQWQAERSAGGTSIGTEIGGQGSDPRFGPVPGYDGDPLPAPELPAAGRLRPRGRVEEPRA